MSAFVDEKPTHELRWERKPKQPLIAILCGVRMGKLQQKWLIVRGGEGRGVEYSEEWRDVPLVVEGGA